LHKTKVAAKTKLNCSIYFFSVHERSNWVELKYVIGITTAEFDFATQEKTYMITSYKHDCSNTVEKKI